jgi:hypothetical protein
MHTHTHFLFFFFYYSYVHTRLGSFLPLEIFKYTELSLPFLKHCWICIPNYQNKIIKCTFFTPFQGGRIVTLYTVIVKLDWLVETLEKLLKVTVPQLHLSPTKSDTWGYDMVYTLKHQQQNLLSGLVFGEGFKKKNHSLHTSQRRLGDSADSWRIPDDFLHW